MIPQNPLKVCFVAPHAYSLFDRSTHYVFGGAEVQAYLLATELARRSDYSVSFIVYDHGQPKIQVLDGVEVCSYHKSFAYVRALLNRLGVCRGIEKHEKEQLHETNDSLQATTHSTNTSSLSGTSHKSVGLTKKPKLNVARSKGRVVRLKNNPLTRPLYHIVMAGQFFVDYSRYTLPLIIERTALLWHTRAVGFEYAEYILDMNRYKTYRDINSDLYISFGANDLTGELASFCRINEKKLILWSISDADFHDSYFHGSNIRNYYGDVGNSCHLALMRAHRWITQNKIQQSLAKTMFLRDSTVIPNPIDLSQQQNPNKPRRERKYALSIGKADATKRPEYFVALCKANPETKFYMVLNPSRQLIEDKIYENRPKNLTIVDSVHRDDVASLMGGAFVLVNSSKFEGFPNVFLEACRAGTPILSLNVDPDNFISDYGCGIAANGNEERFFLGFASLSTDKDSWKDFSTRAFKYVMDYHDQAKCVDQLVDVIKSVVAESEEDEQLVDLDFGGVADPFELFVRNK